MPTHPQWKYISRDIIIEFENIHRLAVKAGTRVERRGTGWGPRYTVHRHSVELLTNTQALFDHDSTYRYIWVSDDVLTDTPPEAAS
jgi:hypothetical protein